MKWIWLTMASLIYGLILCFHCVKSGRRAMVILSRGIRRLNDVDLPGTLRKHVISKYFNSTWLIKRATCPKYRFLDMYLDPELPPKRLICLIFHSHRDFWHSATTSGSPISYAHEYTTNITRNGPLRWIFTKNYTHQLQISCMNTVQISIYEVR